MKVYGAKNPPTVMTKELATAVRLEIIKLLRSHPKGMTTTDLLLSDNFLEKGWTTGFGDDPETLRIRYDGAVNRETIHRILLAIPDVVSRYWAGGGCIAP